MCRAISKICDGSAAHHDQTHRRSPVYEFQGRVALTGAGAYHAGEVGGGMPGG
jgi:hypothetical protein